MKEEPGTDCSKDDQKFSSSLKVVGLLGGQKLEKKYRRWLQFEVVVLCVLMLIVWGLLTLPIVFYYRALPVESEGAKFSGNSNATDLNNIGANLQLDCRDNFFRDEKFFNFCVPICPNWSQDPHAISTLLDVVVFLSFFIGFVAAIIVVVLSVLRYKEMLSYPNSFVVYLSIVYAVQNFFHVVPLLDRKSLYCSSKNLLLVEERVTSFCTVSGIVHSYTTLSGALWWFMLTTALFWKIWFPFSAKRFEAKHQVKYIHIGCGLAGLFIPFIPVIAHMASFAQQVKSDPSTDFVSGGLGFNLPRFPPLICIGRSETISFYAIILPTDLMLAAGITLILLIFWLVHRQNILYKANQLKTPFTFGVAERKLLIIFFYYVIVATLSMSLFSDYSRKADLLQSELMKYFACESFGHDPMNPCERKTFEDLESDTLLFFALIFTGMVPVVNLIFAIRVQGAKKKFELFYSKMKILISKSENN